MMEVSEEDVELELGLSIGGSFKRSDHNKKKRASFDLERIDNGFDLDDKREVHALRRREARVHKQREKRCRSIESEEAQRESNKKTETLQYVPHAPAQFVPFTRVNVIPYWTTTPPAMDQKSAFRTVSCGGFRPFLAHPSFGLNVSEKNCEALVTKTTSEHSSPMCSSSTLSDHRSRSSSFEGEGISSDTRTQQNSSQSSREQQTNNNNNKKQLQSSAQSAQKTTTKPLSQEQPTNNNTSSTIDNSNVVKKPPKPQSHNNNNNNKALPFPQMPYVSARGDGPSGKTVTGLLYRYSNVAEVSIVCVCHGTAFSPAEFVSHAGCSDVSQPLRHITVIPPAF